MRIVGTLSNQIHAQRLSHYLTSKEIANSCEVSFDASSGHMSYAIWIHEEDNIAMAKQAFKEFEQNPSNPKFDAPIPEPEPISLNEDADTPRPPPHRFGTHFTTFMLGLCAMVFFLSTMQQIPLRQEGLSEKTFLITPIQALFMYDLPPAFAQLEEIIKKYELRDQKITNIPVEVKAQIEIANHTPYWHGLYEWVVHKMKGEDPSSGEGSLFVRIRQGEIWRLASPIILHSDLLHILFNMLWLWYLGRPIEQRIGPLRTLLLTLIAAIGSNTLQYLMSGPFFIGYSGIVTAMAGFIWMRERIAPWEGYPLNKATILFLIIFVGAIFALQGVAFFTEVFTTHNFTPNIANTAHIAGAVIGAYLGRFHFFAQRVHK